MQNQGPSSPGRGAPRHGVGLGISVESSSSRLPPGLANDPGLASSYLSTPNSPSSGPLASTAPSPQESERVPRHSGDYITNGGSSRSSPSPTTENPPRHHSPTEESLNPSSSLLPTGSRPSTPSARSTSGLSSSPSDDTHRLTSSASTQSHSSYSSSTTTGTAAQGGLTPSPCSACHLPMTGQFVRALNTVYHLDCFRCADCNSVVAQKFFPIDGPDGKQFPLCERDYFMRLNLICGKCGSALRGSYITACNKKYHVEHFTCSLCSTLFGPQDSYYEHEGNVYCHFHYSTRFATKCVGCSSAILKQFVEINRNMRDECWHPECYMIHKFWNVKITSQRPNSLQAGETELPYAEEESQENPASLKEKQSRMEQQVYRIWTVLSAFEESSAACISEMLRHVSSGQYLEAIRMAEKFILHVEVLFAAIDDLETHFARASVKGMSHVREARLLCRKTVDLFTLLSQTQEMGARRMGMTQELLALVTGLAHYLKILIRIALTGALKLEREHNNRDAMDMFLEKLHRLAANDGNPSARRVVPPLLQLSISPNRKGSEGTEGVAFGFKSLAPEYAGESPFSEREGASSSITQAHPPSDLCAECGVTVEEDCVRLGSYHRWHSQCVRCKQCNKAAAPPPAKKEAVKGNSDEKEPKLTSTRRQPANVQAFVFELDPARITSTNYDLSNEKDIPPPTAIFCVDHAHKDCRKGFQAVSRLEQYAFLLNVALRRLYLLLKRRGFMPASPLASTPTPESEEARASYRDSSDIMRMKSVHLDRKLSATARLPKRSTIVESPTGKIAQPTDVMHAHAPRSGHHNDSGAAASRPQVQRQPSQHGSSTPIIRPPRPPGQGPNASAPQPAQPPGPPRQMPASSYPEHSSSPPSPQRSQPNQQVLRPAFARNNTQVYIIDEDGPGSPTVEEPPKGLEEGITLADIPQLMEVEQAREQHRSLPRQGAKPLVAELSALELLIVKHCSLLILNRSPLKDHFDFDEMLDLIETKKSGFWKQLFKGDKSKVKKKGVFGVPLELLVEREGADSLLGASRTTVRVPSFIDDVISAMKQMDMSIEGIFRKNGNIRRLNDLTDAIDRDPSSVDLTQDNPVQLAALMKKFLRALPDPLLTFKLHKLFVMSQNSQLFPKEADRKRYLHFISLLLPKCHRDTVEVLFVFLKWVASFAHVDEETGSKMDLPNLATVIAPNILYAKGQNAARDESFMAIRVVTQFLEHQDDFWQVPDEFTSIIHDQEYFANSVELPAKEFSRKCDTYLRLKNGRMAANASANPTAAAGSSSNGSLVPSMSASTVPTGTSRDGSEARLIPQRSDPNMISRGRPLPPPDGSRSVQRGKHSHAESQSLERPPGPVHALSDSAGNLPQSSSNSYHGHGMRIGSPRPAPSEMPFVPSSLPSSPRQNFPSHPNKEWGVAPRASPVPNGQVHGQHQPHVQARDREMVPPRSRPNSYSRPSGEQQHPSFPPQNGRNSPAMHAQQRI